jgi:hypothetical protein
MEASKISNTSVILGYRIAAFVIIALGLLTTTGVFAGHVKYQTLFAYTIQSNIVVLAFFAVLIVRTAVGLARGADAKDGGYGFYPVASFAISFAILITMLIFWVILAPVATTTWGNGHLLTFSNLGVHLFCPLLMIGDRLLFYPKRVMRKHEPLFVAICPYAYILESFALGLNRVVYFGPIGIESYYPYPFMDLDANGPWVFVNLLGLTVFFLGLAYGCYFIGNRRARRVSAL